MSRTNHFGAASKALVIQPSVTQQGEAAQDRRSEGHAMTARSTPTFANAVLKIFNLPTVQVFVNPRTSQNPQNPPKN
eukprot:4972883-Amphidinium_carterae.2